MIEEKQNICRIGDCDRESRGNTDMCNMHRLRLQRHGSTGEGDPIRVHHGKSDTTTYQTWEAMKQRCLNPKAKGYEYYGGRGIKICDRWLLSFENFYEDMGDRPEGLTLDRKISNGNYCKENCKWATTTEQARNRRGVRLTSYAVSVIKYLISAGHTQVAIAKAHGVPVSTVGSIAQGISWAEVGELL